MFTFGPVRQVDTVHSRAMADPTKAAPRLAAGMDAIAFVDAGDTIREVRETAKLGAAYGAQLATARPQDPDVEP